MAESELGADVQATHLDDRAAFDRQVRDDAELLKAAVSDGTFNNHQGIIGLEYEFYAVAEPDSAEGRPTAETGGSLVRVPRRLLELIGFEKELGLHNAEMCTSPQPFNAQGIQAQEAEVRSRLRAALNVTTTEGIRLVSDGMWTIPPAGETAASYLTETLTDDGVTLATNMSDAIRYHMMANTDAAEEAGMRIEAPHVSLDSETVMPESLITSIQPHYQVSQATDLPTYFRYALRIAGPLLAVAVNSPLFPPSLYKEGTTVDEVLDDGWSEHRISVFETVLNDPSAAAGKVRFPRDFDTVDEAIDRIAADDTLVPIEPASKGRFDDQFAHFRCKHGTYWRWVRPVFDGASKSGANARIEFRPLPGQPTVRDTVALQAAYAGLLESLPRLEHPVADLDWSDARDNFYAAVRDGLDADLVWITNDGRPTNQKGRLYDDLFDHAADGLRSRGLSDERIEYYLEPLRGRVKQSMTPAAFKRQRAREAAADGAALEEAIQAAQRAYLKQQRATLFDGSFLDWLD